MLTIQELLQAAKHGAGIPSNYRLARVLGVTDLTVNRWQHGRKLPDDATAAKLASMAGLDPGAVVASMHAQRAATAEERTLWESIAQRLATAAAVVVSAILALAIGGAPDAQARVSTQETGAALAFAVLLTFRRSARVLQRLATAARDALAPQSGMAQAAG